MCKNWINLLALGFLTYLQKLQSHMCVIVPMVVQAVGEQFYKLAAEGLTVASGLIRVLRPSLNEKSDFDYMPYVNSIYDAVIEKLKTGDIDQV